MKKIVSFLVALMLLSCAVKQPVNTSSPENQDQLLLSVLWFQKSAEMRALYYQGYNIAKKSLAEKLQKTGDGKPGAVIMDIDETILDNSPSEVYMIKKNVPFSDPMWKQWVSNASAEPCPGALDFVKFAETLKIDVFYVTNREMTDEFQPTIINLRNLGFPFADSIHLVMKTDMSSKEIRRKAIAEKYNILMLIGDNLADFDAVFDKRGEDFGFDDVRQKREKFGTEFIILPNPMYGPWINAAIRDMPGETINAKIMNALEGF
jgi:5'-nucleotidase (lipoprotein e(P4) family)